MVKTCAEKVPHEPCFKTRRLAARKASMFPSARNTADCCGVPFMTYVDVSSTMYQIRVLMSAAITDAIGPLQNDQVFSPAAQLLLCGSEDAMRLKQGRVPASASCRESAGLHG